MNQHFKLFSAKVSRQNKHETIVEITLVDNLIPQKVTLEFWGAAPVSRGVSFSGSGLPYHDAEQAFFNSPNKGKFTPKMKKSIISLQNPNGYFSHLGTRMIKSCVSIKITYEGVSMVELVELGEAAPYRSLTYPSTRNSPMFYDRSHLTFARSQESILRASGYPSCSKVNKCNNWISSSEKSFWGMAVPHS
jgi:hypothetical protein